MDFVEQNKAFVADMIGQKKSLEDYPDRFDENLIMHEPASLPFGGTHRGLDAFRKFYPEVREYYDFSRFELLGVYGDGDTVFATVRAVRAATNTAIFIAEQFIFAGSKLIEVRVHICDEGVAASRSVA